MFYGKLECPHTFLEDQFTNRQLAYNMNQTLWFFRVDGLWLTGKFKLHVSSYLRLVIWVCFRIPVLMFILGCELNAFRFERQHTIY